MRDEGEMCLDTLLTTKDNRSVAISFAGYNIGVALTFSGCISSSMYDYPPEYPVEDQLKSLVPTLVFQVLALFFIVGQTAMVATVFISNLVGGGDSQAEVRNG